MASLTTVIRLSSKRQPTPGPGAYAISSCIGKEGTHPSLAGRRDPVVKTEGGPYEAIPSTIGEGLKYTLHQRLVEKGPPPTPGPNYLPPRFGTGSPQSAFHGYVKAPKFNDGLGGVPGPYSYVDPASIGATKGRGFTVKGREFGPDERKSAGPGPGKYLPNFSPTQRSNGTFQYRPRVEARERKDQIPGPGQYTINRNLAQGPMAFHGYVKQPTSKDVVPGPGKYDVKSKLGKDAPAFSIRPRTEPSTSALTKAPYQVIPTTVGEGKKFSLGIRGKDPPIQVTPGPNYMPPAFGKGSQASSLYSRHGDVQTKARAATPGPGQYPIGTTMGGGKKFTVKARRFAPGEEGRADGPGPGKYLPQYQDGPGPRTIHGLVHDPTDKETKPKYVDIGSTFGKGTPKWTIGNREKLDIGPGIGMDIESKV